MQQAVSTTSSRLDPLRRWRAAPHAFVTNVSPTSSQPGDGPNESPTTAVVHEAWSAGGGHRGRRAGEDDADPAPDGGVDDPDRAAVQVDHPAGDGQAEPGAAVALGRPAAGGTARRPGPGRRARCRGPRRPRRARCRSPSSWACSRDRAAVGQCRTALSTRLASTWCSRSRSREDRQVLRVDLDVELHRRGRSIARLVPRRSSRNSRSRTRRRDAASVAPPSIRDRSSSCSTRPASRSVWSSAVRKRGRVAAR